MDSLYILNTNPLLDICLQIFSLSLGLFVFWQLHAACEESIQLNSEKTNNLIKKWAEEINRSFPKEVQMTYRSMKRCSTSLTVREMEIKTIRYRFISVTMVIIKETSDQKYWWGCREKVAWVGGNKKWFSHYRGCSLEDPQTVKNRTTTGSSNPISGDISEEMKSPSQKDVCTPCSLQHHLQ